MMSEQPKRTELSEIGEFGLIERISDGFRTSNPSTMKGIGDDAAVILAGNKVLLVTTDMLLEGIHFDLSYIPLQHLGYKAVAVNVSDIAAMNGVATQITVNLGLSNRFSLEAVDVLYEGIRMACENYKVDLVGGDTCSSASGLVISITAIGEATPGQLSFRNGAKKGDILCVTGDLAGAYIGLQVLEREKQVYKANPDMQPNLEPYDYMVKRQLKPEARMDIIHELRDLEIVPTAMIDVSDGLASDIFHICKQSALGVKIYEDKIPIDTSTFNTAVEFKLDPIISALNGGEDYELLFTIGQADYEKLKNHMDIHFIGYMTDPAEGKYLITKNGNPIALQAQGWKHF